MDTALACKKPDWVYPRSLDGVAEAHLVALACGDPPEGLESGTLRLLAGELVQLEVEETVSNGTDRRTFKQMPSSRG